MHKTGSDAILYARNLACIRTWIGQRAVTACSTQAHASAVGKLVRSGAAGAYKVPRLWPFTRLPRLGDPSGPGLAPQTGEPLALIPPSLHQTLPRDAPETPRSTSYPR